MQAPDRKNPVYLQPFAKSTPASAAVSSSNRQRRQRHCIPTLASVVASPSLSPVSVTTFSEIWPSRTDYSLKTANNCAI